MLPLVWCVQIPLPLAQSETRPMGGGSVWSDRIRAHDAGRGGWRDAREYTRGARGAEHPGAPNNVETHPRPEPTPGPQRRARSARAGYGAVGGCRRMLRAAEPVTALPGDGPGEPEPEPEPPLRPSDVSWVRKQYPALSAISRTVSGSLSLSSVALSPRRCGSWVCCCQNFGRRADVGSWPLLE